MWEEELQSFPYAHCLRLLNAAVEDDGNPISNLESPYRTLLTLIGKTYRLRSEETWEKVTSVLKECRNEPEPISSREQRQERPSVDASTLPTHLNHQATARTDVQELPRYTMALKEHCERHGEIFRYEEELLRFYPASFKVTVRTQGLSFEGTASSKKLARHLASEAACMEMRIGVI